MKSKWFHLKEQALVMRQSGMSITTIERKLGIARSTLSGWFKEVQLSESQAERLHRNKVDGWARARVKAAESHRAKKALRLHEAKQSALETLSKIKLDGPLLELALAMLYLGEGAKSNTSSMASSDPEILKFVLAVLERNHSTPRESVRCELHLRADQSKTEIKKYWSETLHIPITNFKYVYFDQRTAGRPTYDSYKGVCVIYCGSIAIQRKLIYLYKLFCEKVAELGEGA
jgi:hypothetical protein